MELHVLMKIAGCAVGLLASNVSFAQASDPSWPDALVCQAGVQSYFYLKQPPGQIADNNGWFVFRGASGGIYDCQVRGTSIALRWKSHNGPMTSNKTQFSASGPVLTVHPGAEKAWRFRRVAAGYASLN